MQYLVTGATGFLGNNIVRDLLAAGEQVRVLARCGPDAKPLAGLDVEIVGGDVRDAAAVRRAVDGIDVVIHCAGYVHIGWKHADEQRAVNVEGTRNVAQGARTCGARLVHISSNNALGLGRRDQPADEDNALPGILPCPYVLTKREAEEVVLQEVERGLWATIVNAGYMLGPWDWKPSSGRLLLEVAKFAAFAPTGALSVCDVRDVSAGVLSAAKSGASGRRYIMAGHNVSYLDVFQRFAHMGRVKGPRMYAGPIVRLVGSVCGDAWGRISGREPGLNSASLSMSRQDHCFSSSRAQAELGYKIRPMEETISAAWQWFLENGYVK